MNESYSIVFILVVAGLVSVGTSLVNVESVLAIEPIPCPKCAKEFSPGQEKKVTEDSDFESKSAKEFAPGQEKAGITPEPCPACNSASEFAPGQEKVEIIGPE